MTFGISFAEETFNGTAEGHNGPVNVTVKIGDGGVLTQAEVTSHIETAGISDRAIKEMPQRIIEAQSFFTCRRDERSDIHQPEPCISQSNITLKWAS